MKRLISILLVLVSAFTALSQTASQLVKDIVPGAAGGYLLDGIDYNGKLIFSYTTQNSYFGTQLWISDGTDGGTQKIKSFNLIRNSLNIFNNKVYFVAADSVHGLELWVTDGTTNGTHMVKDINPAGNGLAPDFVNTIFPASDRIYFAANDGVHGYELWSSDGTDAGTQMIKDINATGDGIEPSTPSMVVINNKAFFIATDSGYNFELWISDGTNAGTHLVLDMDSSANTDRPHKLMPYNDKVVFYRYLTGAVYDSLFISDGTASGTYSLGAVPFDANDFTDNAILDNKLYFLSANTYPAQIAALYVTDGITVHPVDTTFLSINAQPTPAKNGSMTGLTAYNNKLLFAAHLQADTHTFGLWGSDGSTLGTELPYAGPDTFPSFPRSLTQWGGSLFFHHLTVSGVGLFKADGNTISEINTTTIHDPYVSDPLLRTPLIPVGNSLYFSMYSDTAIGPELYKIDLFPAAVTNAQAVNTTLNIYPNPANDIVHIECTGAASVAVYNMIGGIVYATSISQDNELGIQTATWPAGIYTIMSQNKNGSKTYGKFVKE